MSGKIKPDWQKIKLEYVQAVSNEQRPSLTALAVTHGCSPSYLREKASAENWKAEADRYLAELQQQQQKQKLFSVGSELAKWDEQCFQLTKAAIGQVYTHLKDATQGDKLEPKDLDSLTRSLQRLHELGRTMIGDEPESEAETIAPDQYSQLSEDELVQLYQKRLQRD